MVTQADFDSLKKRVEDIEVFLAGAYSSSWHGPGPYPPTLIHAFGKSPGSPPDPPSTLQIAEAFANIREQAAETYR